MPDSIIVPKPWLSQPRTKPIKLIEIHATRGPASNTPAQDYAGTINWMQSNNNVHVEPDGSKWGGSCSYILGPNGEMCTVLGDNRMPTYSAGYGGAGSTYAIDEYGISYEWAQPASQPPFSDAMYRRGAKEIAAKCKQYGIPPVFVTAFDQRGTPPTGIIRHDRCENGVKLGKSDPGPQFNEALFLSYVKAEMEDDMTLTADQEAKLDKLLNDQVFVKPQGRSEVYRLTEDQTLVHAVDPQVFASQGTFPEVKELPKASTVWKLRAVYPGGVPAELLA